MPDPTVPFWTHGWTTTLNIYSQVGLVTLVSGAGAAAHNSIGLVLVGGMTIGTFFTLFDVPSIYMLVARDHNKK